MTQITLIGNTSGTSTIQAADIAGNTVITIPVNSGTIHVVGLSSSTIRGCKLSKASNTTVAVAAGGCVDSTRTVEMLCAGYTINFGTTGANALDTGALATNTWYHCFVIAKTDGTVAALGSTSATSPTMPAGYTYKRRIGMMYYSATGPAFLDIIQNGDYFLFGTQITLLNGPNYPNGTTTTFSTGLPSGLPFIVELAGFVNSNVSTGWGFDLWSPAQTRPAASDYVAAGGYNDQNGFYVNVYTVTGNVAAYAVVSGGSLFPYVMLRGYWDRRGQDD
jgi:hypothetical protein